MKHYFKKNIPLLDSEFEGNDPYLSELGRRAHMGNPMNEFYDDAGRNAVSDWVN